MNTFLNEVNAKKQEIIEDDQKAVSKQEKREYLVNRSCDTTVSLPCVLTVFMTVIVKIYKNIKYSHDVNETKAHICVLIDYD